MLLFQYHLGLSIKGVRSQERGLSSSDILRISGKGGWGSSEVDVCTFCVSARTREVELVRTSGRWVNLSRFYADVFYGRPLNDFVHLYLP